MTSVPATALDLRVLARENFDYALMARVYALRMRTLEFAALLHAFADAAYLEALAFGRAVEKGMEA
jgi:hypothetical protein